MKFSSILKKINFKSRKSMLKTGAILFWTDLKLLFNWNMDDFKSNFLSRGQLGSKRNDKFFLSVLKMWQCCKYFFGNLIFALTARTLSGNRLKHVWPPCWMMLLHHFHSTPFNNVKLSMFNAFGHPVECCWLNWTLSFNTVQHYLIQHVERVWPPCWMLLIKLNIIIQHCSTLFNSTC